MSRIDRRPSANRDLVAAYRYYAKTASLRVADRFFTHAEATFKRLARLPGLGAVYDSHEPAFADLRYLRISRFADQIISYKPIPDGIEVYRLRGARHGLR